MKDKVEVSRINIKIGKKEIPLTLDEAHELQELLNQTFGKKETVFVPGSPVIVPYPVYRRPYRYWDICWTSSGNDTSVGTLTYSLSTGE